MFRRSEFGERAFGCRQADNITYGELFPGFRRLSIDVNFAAAAERVGYRSSFHKTADL